MNTNGNGQKQLTNLEYLDRNCPGWRIDAQNEADRRFKELKQPWRGWLRKLCDEPWKLYMIAAIALLGARQLNTVPDRYFAWGNREIRKVDDLFGSTYHLYETTKENIPGTGKQNGWDGSYPNAKPHIEYETEDVETDIGQSKVFNDLATMAGAWHVR